jgi:hypothetical protein
MSNILNQIKLSGITYDLQDASAIHSLDGYWTSGQTESAITAATNALAEAVAEELSAKTDVSAFTAYTSSTETALSGKLDTSVFETYSGNVDTALASKFAGATWNSTDKKIYFYDNASATGTALAYIDGTDFVKDGFLESVTIENKTISGESVPCLVFIWNTDAGIQETDIPLSGIFDPTNYVDVNTFTAYTAATDATLSGKADASTVVTDVRAGETASGFFNLNIYQTKNGAETMVGSFGGFHTDGSDGLIKDGLGVLKVNTNVIQEKLTSGTNIKTINGNSLLGSGNLEVQTLPTVQGTTLIFS